VGGLGAIFHAATKNHEFRLDWANVIKASACGFITLFVYWPMVTCWQRNQFLFGWVSVGGLALNASSLPWYLVSTNKSLRNLGKQHPVN
jgi:hypothetical protein